MTRKTDHPDPLLPAFLSSLILAVRFCTQWILRALFFWAKAPISNAFRLKSASVYWPILRWLFLPLQWAAGLYAMAALLIAIHDLYTGHLLLGPARQAVLVFVTAPLAALVFMIFDWAALYSADPQVRMDLAGKRAEAMVKKIIELRRPAYAPCEAFHGALLVFNRGASNEYSVEVDHILITPHNLFLIETKYKSGTIHANPDSPTWKTETDIGPGVMRNALRQVKNAARVLEKEFAHIPPIVPLVAIHGEGVTIVGGPGNVVSAYELPRAIEAFEFSSQRRAALNPSSVLNALQSRVSTDASDWERHIARADVVRYRAELHEIVRTSSID